MEYFPRLRTTRSGICQLGTSTFPAPSSSASWWANHNKLQPSKTQFLSHNDIIMTSFSLQPLHDTNNEQECNAFNASFSWFENPGKGGPAHLRICQERYWVNLRKSSNSAIRNHTCPTHSLTSEMKNWSTLEGLGNMIGNSENNHLDP